MKLWDHPLTENDLRQCLRIAAGATIGFTICKVMGWNNGVFFTVTPILLLGMVPVINAHAARQLIAAGVVVAIEVMLIYALFGFHPVLATLVVALLFLSKFICMSKGSLYLFGANALLSLSIMVHFNSFTSTDASDLAMCNLMANVISVLLAYLLNYLIPDAEPRPPRPQMPPKTPNRTRHEAILGTSLAIISFWVFQMLDLQDSMSAQSTSVLLLFPMNWSGALQYAKKRAFGTILGVSYGLFCQLMLYTWSGGLYFIIPLLWIGMLLFSYCHVKEAAGSGVGFGGLTTLGILFGQYLSPGQDLIFNAMYRIGCIGFGIVATLMLMFWIHRWLNRHPTTRFGD